MAFLYPQKQKWISWGMPKDLYMKYVVACAQLLLLFLDTSKSIRTILHFINLNTSHQSSRAPSCQMPPPCMVPWGTTPCGLGQPSSMQMRRVGMYVSNVVIQTYLSEWLKTLIVHSISYFCIDYLFFCCERQGDAICSSWETNQCFQLRITKVSW